MQQAKITYNIHNTTRNGPKRHGPKRVSGRALNHGIPNYLNLIAIKNYISYGFIPYVKETYRTKINGNPVLKIRYNFLLIQKKMTYAFGDFLSGKYTTKLEIINLLNNMTVKEVNLILSSGSLDKILIKMGIRYPYNFSLESACKFKRLKRKITFDIISSLNYAKIKSNELPWEFPKGRQKINENSLQTALRELYEETMLLEDDIIYTPRLDPNLTIEYNILSNLKGPRKEQYSHDTAEIETNFSVFEEDIILNEDIDFSVFDTLEELRSFGHQLRDLENSSYLNSNKQIQRNYKEYYYTCCVKESSIHKINGVYFNNEINNIGWFNIKKARKIITYEHRNLLKIFLQTT